jgi:3-oxoacyl-[acyl-carrier protein] reductase
MTSSRPLVDKAALIIGGSRGIGRAVAERLAHDGAAVAFSYLQDEAAARSVLERIGQANGRAFSFRADLGDTASVRRLFEDAEQALGGLDIVVVNPSVVAIKPLLDVTEDEYDRVFGVNARGTFFALQEAGRRVRDGGRILATSTGGTQMLMTQLAAYLGSKAAVEQFVRVLARELGPRQVTVNAVSPGFTDTDMLPARDRAVASAASPFARIGTPEDVAETFAFLAGAGGRWTTGQNIPAGGGVF